MIDMKTLYLKAGEEKTAETAAEILRRGGVVAIPTETVYGLAANALDTEAVKKIFAAKGRPQDNPLIVHISSMEELGPLVKEIDPRAYKLAEKFWPGPLTMVMKKSELIPDEVCAGLDTVAIRMPSHPVARDVIKASGLPLAAPSANTSGRPSPTKAAHVKQDLDGKIDCIIDGGDCDIGVESTVITLDTDPPVLLRPGGVTPEQLESVLGKIEISHAVFEKLDQNEKAQSPGMKYRHYSPAASVSLIRGSFEKYEKYLKAQNSEICAVCFEGEGKYFERYIEYGKSDDSLTQAQHIFDALRQVDEKGYREAYVRCPGTGGIGLAVYNRLLRSAAFRVIDLDYSIHVYGLTGQTGAGKSTVCGMFREKGFYVIDTDLLAREAIKTERAVSQLKAAFGEDIFSGEEADRRELARRAFATKENTLLLNSIMHPVITELSVRDIRKAEESGAKAVIIDGAVLLDSPIKGICEKIICVTADEKTRLERIMRRDGISREDALLRMKAQDSEDGYVKRSDIIIENGNLDATKLEVDRITEEILK